VRRIRRGTKDTKERSAVISERVTGSSAGRSTG